MDDLDKKYDIFVKGSKQDDPLDKNFKRSIAQSTGSNTSTSVVNFVNISNNTASQAVNYMNDVQK